MPFTKKIKKEEEFAPIDVFARAEMDTATKNILEKNDTSDIQFLSDYDITTKEKEDISEDIKGLEDTLHRFPTQYISDIIETVKGKLRIKRNVNPN